MALGRHRIKLGLVPRHDGAIKVACDDCIRRAGGDCIHCEGCCHERCHRSGHGSRRASLQHHIERIAIEDLRSVLCGDWLRECNQERGRVVGADRLKP